VKRLCETFRPRQDGVIECYWENIDPSRSLSTQERTDVEFLARGIDWKALRNYCTVHLKIEEELRNCVARLSWFNKYIYWFIPT